MDITVSVKLSSDERQIMCMAFNSWPIVTSRPHVEEDLYNPEAFDTFGHYLATLWDATKRFTMEDLSTVLTTAEILEKAIRAQAEKSYWGDRGVSDVSIIKVLVEARMTQLVSVRNGIQMLNSIIRCVAEASKQLT